jgi:hypothetical protein
MGLQSGFPMLRAIFLAINREKVALNRWKECRAAFSFFSWLLNQLSAKASVCHTQTERSSPQINSTN